MSARANEPAYPCDGPNVPAYGLTIREAAAIAAMQGLIPVQFTYGEESIAKLAVLMADALLRELERKP